jgi:hypothetical protein
VTQSLARTADWRCRAPLQGSHGDLMRLASGRGMVEVAATQYASPDWRLVQVCVHEAGHAAVASALGCDASVEIAHTPAGMAGWCHFSGRTRQRAERTIALAGSIAEHLAEYGFWSAAKDVRSAVSPCYLSTSDRILAGDFSPADVDATCELVRKTWPQVFEIAHQVLAQQVSRWEH